MKVKYQIHLRIFPPNTSVLNCTLFDCLIWDIWLYFDFDTQLMVFKCRRLHCNSSTAIKPESRGICEGGNGDRLCGGGGVLWQRLWMEEEDGGV